MTLLHGFLGLPGDWSSVFCGAAHKAPSWHPLFRSVVQSEACGLSAVADALNRQAEGSVLIGYSMGGRIALHMLLRDGAAQWKRAVIVSASPGLPTEGERKDRLAQDRQWAQRFRHDPWTSVVEDWERQAVFSGEPNLTRKEEDFSREELSLALEKGSVGAQSDLRPALRNLEIPVLWIAGARDKKYAALARECAALNPRFEVTILEGAGHRAPWSATRDFRSIVDTWTSKEW